MNAFAFIASREEESSRGAGSVLLVRHLPGLADYRVTWEAMRRFTDARHEGTPDELWLCEHPPVFTLGQAGRMEHVRDPGSIPVVRTDRGGQATYHGPGQTVAYLLLDLRRARLGVRRLVEMLELSAVDLLAAYGVAAAPKREAPGVYVGQSKIAALGLRVRNGRSYHGLALNVSVDLSPFLRIDPCGFPGLPVVRLCDLLDADLGERMETRAVGEGLAKAIGRRLGLEARPAPAWGEP